MSKDLTGEEMNALLGATAERTPVGGTAAETQAPALPDLEAPGAGAVEGAPNLDLLMDVPLELTVELGRARRLMKEILELAPGVVLELDRAAGEPVDVLVNGEVIARGEVVVIDENFGIRITDIATKPGRTARAD